MKLIWSKDLGCWQRTAIATLISCSCVFWGCAPDMSKVENSNLYGEFTDSIASWSEAIEQGQHYVKVDIKPSIDRDQLAKRIRVVLSIPFQESGRWPYRNEKLLKPELREIDFWASVYAELTNQNYTIHIDMTEKALDRQIRKLTGQ